MDRTAAFGSKPAELPGRAQQAPRVSAKGCQDHTTQGSTACAGGVYDNISLSPPCTGNLSAPIVVRGPWANQCAVLAAKRMRAHVSADGSAFHQRGLHVQFQNV
jgi:hypothetical protein